MANPALDPPTDLPVIQPDKSELVVSYKTAKAMGNSVSSVILAHAGEIME